MSAQVTTPRSLSGPGARAMRWARQNLFRTWYDSLLTVIFGGLAVYLLIRLAVFVFANARWEVIEVNLRLLMVGTWPSEELAVISIAVAALALWMGLIAGLVHGRRVIKGTAPTSSMMTSRRAVDLSRRFGLIIGTVLLLLALTDTFGPWLTAGAALVAGIFGRVVGGLVGRIVLPKWVARVGALALVAVPLVVYVYLSRAVPLSEWEGFFFNISAAVAGIILCFPIGVLLALARRSKLRLLQSLSIVYIEFVRGSPLFVLLLMANVSLGFFIPNAVAPSKVVRGVIVFAIFTGAYLAEIVRGGLQSVPEGQVEAAKALGLSPTKQMALIVVPQALRNTIPAQIGQFISLFKDTTLAGLALGILDLLSVGQVITQQEGFRGQGLIIETLAFVGFIFWVGSFTMSRESQRLERKLGVGTR